jgi:hypothetical protein
MNMEEGTIFSVLNRKSWHKPNLITIIKKKVFYISIFHNLEINEIYRIFYHKLKKIIKSNCLNLDSDNEPGYLH